MLKTTRAAAALALIVPVAASAAPAQGTSRDDWVTVRNTMQINASADKVWSVLGGFCDLPRNLGETCTYLRGTGGLGTIRLTDGDGVGVKTGEGKYNYSFFFTQGHKGPPVALRYHTNLEVIPSADDKTSTLVVTVIYDQSLLPDDAARAARRASHINGFAEHFRTTKALAEAK